MKLTTTPAASADKHYFTNYLGFFCFFPPYV